jgi:membrane-associated protein
MDLLKHPIDLILHLDRYLDKVIVAYGAGTYLILFLIVFAETGLVVTPFLPGDSLLFAAGAIAGRGQLNAAWLVILFTAAALTGDNTNYLIGKLLGPRILRGEDTKLLNRKHLDRTHAFFEKHGGKTIILARFVPIVRTFTPFVAGIGAMAYPRFLAYSIAGAILWVNLCVWAGRLFGGLAVVKNNFSLVLIAVVLLSVLPAIIEVLKHRTQEKRAAAAVTDGSDGA